MDKRVHAIYSGRVHGVGFRYSVERAAASAGLAGWVKNVDDGRVEVVCEGEEEELRRFLTKISSLFQAYIRDADITWCKATGEFAGFDIRF